MKISHNVDLSKKCTFHIGGNALDFYEPETEGELIKLAGKLTKEKKEFKILSGGSNLLINDEIVFPCIISMRSACCELKKLDEDLFYCGASNRIQKAIHFANECGYGGFEELYGLPAMIGGIIYMNAGIGSKTKTLFNIGDFVEKIRVFDLRSRSVTYVSNSECCFSHRHSVFQTDQYIILGAVLRLKKQTPEESAVKIANRVKACKARFEYGNGCFGTCFSTANGKLLKIISLLPTQGVYQSKGNANWLVNDGTGSYRDAIKIIKKCQSLHYAMRQPVECEVIIWS